jgi:outer membrane protein
MIKRKLWTGIFLGLLGLIPLPARAQGEKQLEPRVAQTEPSEASTREGVVHIHLQKPPMEGELRLTLNRAIELALERNPTLTVEKIHLEQAREKIEEEKGYYDPLLNFRASVGRADNVVASRFFPTGIYTDGDRSQGVGFQARTYTGGRFGIGLDFKRLRSTSNTQTLSPQYGASFAFTFSHALLRDFGWDINLTRIRVAEKGEGVAEHKLSQRVSQVVQEVEETYWNLSFQHQDLEVKRTSLELAQGLLKQSEELLQAGRVAGLSVLEARAGVAAREEAVIAAESEEKKLEDQLKLLLHIDLGKINLTPVDEALYEASSLDLERSLQLALKQRPEILGLQRELEQREMEKKYASNQTLPRLDLAAQYGMAGLSGRPNKTCVDPTAVICQPVGNVVAGSIFADETRSIDAFDRFFTRNAFDNWSVELKLQIPLWNRTAKAQLSDANLRLIETKARVRAVRDQIEAEVRNASRETLTAIKRMEASREAVKFGEDQLNGTRRKFEAGLATSYEVLQVLEDLAKSRTSEVKALRDYNVGQSKVRLAEGSVLEKHRIELKKPPRYVFQEN